MFKLLKSSYYSKCLFVLIIFELHMCKKYFKTYFNLLFLNKALQTVSSKQ